MRVNTTLTLPYRKWHTDSTADRLDFLCALPENNQPQAHAWGSTPSGRLCCNCVVFDGSQLPALLRGNQPSVGRDASQWAQDHAAGWMADTGPLPVCLGGSSGWAADRDSFHRLALLIECCGSSGFLRSLCHAHCCEEKQG